MDTKHYAQNFARGFDSWRKLEGITVFLAFVAGWFSLSVAVFLRHSFGERHLGWVNLWFAYSAVLCMAVIGNAASGFTGHGTSTLIVLVWVAFIAASAFHRFVIWQKIKANVQWHSFYVGTSWLPIDCSNELKQTWIEPGLVLALGLMFLSFSPIVATWLIVSALSLWLHAQITTYFEHQMVLDAIDAQLEAQHMGAAIAGKPAHETAGVTIAESVRKRVRDDPDAHTLLAGLSPELRAIVTAVRGRDGERPKAE